MIARARAEDRDRPVVDIVLKVGGALLRDPAALRRTMAEISRAPRKGRLLIVPGGGLFADAVRDLDRRLSLTADAAHWMAVLAMDQYAHVLAGLIDDSVRVHDHDEIAAVVQTGHIAVLAPYRWLYRADPLPHSWDVTSDSIAAWIAIALRAPHLLLLKPVVAPLAEVVDVQFDHTLASETMHPPAVRVCTSVDAALSIAEFAASPSRRSSDRNSQNDGSLMA